MSMHHAWALPRDPTTEASDANILNENFGHNRARIQGCINFRLMLRNAVFAHRTGEMTFPRHGDQLLRRLAINTMMPPYAPTPLTPGPDGVVDFRLDANAMAGPPQTHDHIGDKPDGRGVEWAWYASAFQGDARSSRREPHERHDRDPELPVSPSAIQLLPQSRAGHRGPREASARRRPRRRRESTNRFLADARAGRLPVVTFYKQQGNLNMHPGYANVASGGRHIVHTVKALRASPQWKNMS